MSGSVKGIIVEIGGDTSALQKSLSSVNSKTSSLSKELRGVNSLLKFDSSNAELLEQKQDLLNETIEETSKKLKILKEAHKKAIEEEANGTKISEENWRALQREIANTENKLKKLQLEVSNFSKSGKNIEEFGQKVSNVGNKIDELGNKTSAVSAGLVVGGSVLVKNAGTLEQAVQRYIASTDESIEKTEQYKETIKAISNDNFGDGFEDIADSMAKVKTQIKNIDDIELKNATEQAIALRDLYGYDVSESIRAAKALMDNFEINISDALDFIVQGRKKGLDFSNELLDNINEYSVQFDKLGFSAQDMFNIFKIGADNGAFNLDKIGDAVKEFSIRAIDGSKTTIEGFEKLGFNADEMAQKFASGGEIAKQAFTEVVQKIGNMDDKVEQSLVGVNLFGTMWEDLGPTVITSLNQMDNGIVQSSGTMQNSIEQLYDSTQRKAEKTLKKINNLTTKFGDKLLPVIDNLIDNAEEFIDSLEDLSDEEVENIIKIGMMVVAMGPLTKILGTTIKLTGNTAKGIGILSQAVGVLKSGAESSNSTVNNLAKGIGAIASPAGLAATAITAATAIIVSEIKKAEEESKKSFSNMGAGASEFISGIDSATSYLDSFNTTLFASSEEQQKLQDDMNEVQKGITEICKRASDERRGYTQEEITQLDEYFTKLRELKNRELEIQKSISSAISQQAQQNAQTFQGTLEEYKINSQEWIKTAEEQANKELEIINNRTTQEIALLQQRYGEKATMENEEYAREYNLIMENKNKAIQEANDEVAKVNLAYSNGYLERAKLNDGFYTTLEEYNAKIEAENARHNSSIENIENNALLTQHNKNGAKHQENYRHKEEMKKIWDDMYKNMSDEQEKELGTWMAMVAQTQMYGGDLTEETEKIVDSILESYETMPEKSKEAMEDTMSGMLEGMKDKEPSLYAKATSIAQSVLSRLKKAFDIHSPSRKTREIFKFAMQGAELGIEDEEKKLYKQVDNLARGVLHKFNKLNINMQPEKINNAVIDETKTIFTTPNITFNVQKLDEANLEKCFNYINNKFGSSY